METLLTWYYVPIPICYQLYRKRKSMDRFNPEDNGTDFRTHYYGDSCPGGHGQFVVNNDPDFEGLIYKDDGANRLIAEVNAARRDMMDFYLVQDDNQSGLFISAIIFEESAEDAIFFVLKEYREILGPRPRMFAQRLHLTRQLGSHYLVKKKG